MGPSIRKGHYYSIRKAARLAKLAAFIQVRHQKDGLGAVTAPDHLFDAEPMLFLIEF
jgi:hypothetical protein